uniref:Uncharacterized protein n=1 Tax=Laticauda laticaudata TaxID=8630 RepID=A0A8C5RGM8_LATLA
MAGAPLPLLLLAAGLGAALWPQPQWLLQDPQSRCRLSPRQFRFAYANGSAVAPGCEVLDGAFQRYWLLLFPPGHKEPSGAGGEGKGGKREEERNWGPLAPRLWDECKNHFFKKIESGSNNKILHLPPLILLQIQEVAVFAASICHLICSGIKYFSPFWLSEQVLHTSNV